jgi:hypothetical protein
MVFKWQTVIFDSKCQFVKQKSLKHPPNFQKEEKIERGRQKCGQLSFQVSGKFWTN